MKFETSNSEMLVVPQPLLVDADREQIVIAQRLEVRRHARHLELAGDARVRVIREVDRDQRIGVLERRQIGLVADEPRRREPLADGDAAEMTDRGVVRAVLREHEEWFSTGLSDCEP